MTLRAQLGQLKGSRSAAGLRQISQCILMDLMRDIIGPL